MLSALIRGWTLLTRELVEILRQPLLVLVLVLGPFLILLVFALGHRADQPPLQAVLVLPRDVDLPRDPGFWGSRFGKSVDIVAVTTDESAARVAVTSQQSDLALVVPSNAMASLRSGHQAVVQVLHDESDPTERAYISYVAYVLSSELNKQVIAEAARQAQDNIRQSRQSLDDLKQTADALPETPDGRVGRLKMDLGRLDTLTGGMEKLAPGLMAAPFTSRVEDVSGRAPSFVAFYSPGVLALLLQHMAITFMALSLVRDRLLGMIEFYKVAPTSMFGVLVGKYLSYGLLSMAVGGALTFLMTRFLGVPLRGDPFLYWGTLALLVFASLGIGLTISLLSSSQENAVQLTMLVLLASVFFSGLLLPLADLQTPATQLSSVLPVSHAVVALQDIMLRGRLSDFVPLEVIGGAGLLFLLINLRLLHGELYHD